MVVRIQRAQGAKTEKKLNKRLAKWWPICIRENFIHCHASSSAFHILKYVENFVRF